MRADEAMVGIFSITISLVETQETPGRKKVPVYHKSAVRRYLKRISFLQRDT